MKDLVTLLGKVTLLELITLPTHAFGYYNQLQLQPQKDTTFTITESNILHVDTRKHDTLVLITITVCCTVIIIILIQ